MSAVKICLFITYAFVFSFLTSYICFYNPKSPDVIIDKTSPYWLWIANVNIRLDTTVNQNSTIRIAERFYIGQESVKQFNRLYQTKTCDATIMFYPYFITFPPNSTCFEKNVTLYNNAVWK